jgi:NADH-quinone oxidoreductase subunit I
MMIQNLIDAVRGLWSLAVGMKVTGVELMKPRITVHYPRREVDNLATYRGHIELVPVDEDPLTPRCVMCMRCAETCPSQCITIRMHAKDGNTGRFEDQGLLLGPNIKLPQSRHLPPPPEQIERVLDVFRLNYSTCSLCGLCVQGCPVGAIRFSRNSYLIGTSRADFQLDLIERLRRQASAAGPARRGAKAA